jgi:hypothetical protein
VGVPVGSSGMQIQSLLPLEMSIPFLLFALQLLRCLFPHYLPIYIYARNLLSIDIKGAK